MKLLIDVNLSPLWVQVLEGYGYDAVHWSTVGDGRAPDRVIMAWALAHGYAVFTHDLDFGALLALTRAEGPSVIQVRAQDVLPGGTVERVLVSALRQHAVLLDAGVLIVIDESRSRARILPLLR